MQTCCLISLSIMNQQESLILTDEQQLLLQDILPTLQQQVRNALISTLTPKFDAEFLKRVQNLRAENLSEGALELLNSKRDLIQQINSLSAQISLIDLQIDKILQETERSNSHRIITQYILKNMNQQLLQTQSLVKAREEIEQEAWRSLHQWYQKEKVQKFKLIYVNYKKRLDKEQSAAIENQENYVSAIQEMSQDVKQSHAELARFKAKLNVQLKANQDYLKLLKNQYAKLQQEFYAESARLDKQIKLATANKPKSDVGEHTIKLYQQIQEFENLKERPVEKQSLWEIPSISLSENQSINIDFKAIKNKVMNNLIQRCKENQKAIPISQLIKPAEQSFRHKYEKALKGKGEVTRQYLRVCREGVKILES